jgi:hypothetical protein
MNVEAIMCACGNPIIGTGDDSASVLFGPMCDSCVTIAHHQAGRLCDRCIRRLKAELGFPIKRLREPLPSDELRGPLGGPGLSSPWPHDSDGFLAVGHLTGVVHVRGQPTQPRPGEGTMPVSGTGLIGRDHQVAAVRDGLERMLEGAGGLILVTSEAGIRKTALVTDALSRLAPERALVLDMACWSGDSSPDYWLWTQVVRGLRRSCTAVEWVALPVR